MTTFIVIHKLPNGATQESVIAVAKTVLARLPDNVRWLRSWVIPEDDHVICEWEAPGSDVIRAMLEGLTLFPIQAIRTAEFIDPAWFAE